MKPWQAEPSIRLLNFRKWIRTVKPNGILVVCTKFSYYKPRHINFLLLLAKEIPRIDLLMRLSRFYPGVPDALKFASSRLYIVTTKQVWYISFSSFLSLFFDKGDTTFGIRAIPMPHISVLDWPSYLSRHKLASFILRKCKGFFHVSSATLSFLFQSRFADALLRELAGVTIPPERIYGLGTGLVSVFFLWLRKLFVFLWRLDRLLCPFLISSFSLPWYTKYSFQSQGRSAEAASKETRAPRTETAVRYFAAYMVC